MEASLSGLLKVAHAAVHKSLMDLPRRTFSEIFSKRDLKVRQCGIYMLWHPDGTLLYVGKAKSLRMRLKQHLSVGNLGLLEYILADRDERAPTGRGHRCSCGREIRCQHGRIILRNKRLIQSVRKEVARTHLVSFTIITPEDFAARDLSFERYVQWILKPKYGRAPSEE